MELLQEFLFAVCISLLLSFFLSKLFTMASSVRSEHKSLFRLFQDVARKFIDTDERLYERITKSTDLRGTRQSRSIAVANQFAGNNSKTENLMNDGCKLPAMCEKYSAEFEEEDLELPEKFIGKCCDTEDVRDALPANLDSLDEKLVEESPEKSTFSEGEIEIVEDEMRVSIFEENQAIEIDEVKRSAVDYLKEGLTDDEDDWEGVERTEIQKVFNAAVLFVGSKHNAERVAVLGSNVKMQLYGLHKVATEGPCHDHRPMAFKVSSRAKWNAWQRLGNMSPEVAMEQYVTLLSMSIPRWMGDDPGGDDKQCSSEAGPVQNLYSEFENISQIQLGLERQQVTQIPEALY